MDDIEAVKEALGLVPLPHEGGFFVETFRSAESAAIYYLLDAASASAMHRLRCDEVFHFYAGDPVEMLLLAPDLCSRIEILGPAIGRGERPQIVVPRGTWQGARLVDGGRFALIGTTTSPAFAWSDFELGDIEALKGIYPSAADAIIRRRPR